jgi:hypothetical protein
MKWTMVVDAMTAAQEPADQLLARALEEEEPAPGGAVEERPAGGTAEEPASWWVLSAVLSERDKIMVSYLSRQREPLEQLAEAREFRFYGIAQVAPEALPAIENSPRGRSICYFHPIRSAHAIELDNGTHPGFIDVLTDAGCFTLGQVMDLGWRGLQKLGLNLYDIMEIDRRLSRVHLELISLNDWETIEEKYKPWATVAG